MFAYLVWSPAAMLFDDEQAGRGHLEHEAVFRQDAGGAPDPDPVVVRPHAQVDAGRARPRGRLAPGRHGNERQPPLEDQRAGGRFARQERQRNLRDVPFLAAQAGPERRVDHGVDGLNRRQRREIARTVLTSRVEVPGKPALDAPGQRLSRRIGAVRHNSSYT